MDGAKCYGRNFQRQGKERVSVRVRAWEWGWVAVWSKGDQRRLPLEFPFEQSPERAEEMSHEDIWWNSKCKGPEQVIVCHVWCGGALWPSRHLCLVSLLCQVLWLFFWPLLMTCVLPWAAFPYRPPTAAQIFLPPQTPPCWSFVQMPFSHFFFPSPFHVLIVWYKYLVICHLILLLSVCKV